MSEDAQSAALRNADAAARLEAQQEFGRPVVVEAGAGTGKTGLLVARIVAWSLGGGWSAAEARLEASPGAAGEGEGLSDERIAADVLSHVAAITFTEAAAAEMARRTGAALVAIEAGEIPVFVDERVLPAEPVLRASRARALAAALDHLVVRTIHAFCRGLLAQHPLEAGLHPGFEVDADHLMRDGVVREVVEAAVQAGYGDAGDEDWIALAVDGVGPSDIEQALADLLDAGVSDDTLAEAAFPPEQVAAWLGDFSRAVADCRAVEGGCLDGLKENSVARRTCVAMEETASRLEAAAVSDLASFDSLVAALREIWESPRKRLADWSRGVFNKGETEQLDDRAGALREAAAELVIWVASLEELSPLKLERARRCLRPLLSRADAMLRVRGAASYDALLRETRDLLRKKPGVRRAVRGDLDQLLVDEFQDTDPLQCEIIRWIALADGEEGAPGLFLVGDPKQSIYGWRRADLRAYEEFLAAVLGADREPARLSVNYRSRPAILDEVKRVIEPVMRPEPGLQPRFEPLIPKPGWEDAAESGPGVEYWVSWRWNSADAEPHRRNAGEASRLEAAALARDLVERQSAAPFPWREVGVLFRSRSDQEIYLSALRDAGVPYAVERDRAYYRRREILDASALVRSVLDPNDHVALLAWLRSASVGVPDAALLPLWTRGFPALASDLSTADAASLAQLDGLVDAAVADLPAAVPGLERVQGWDACLRQALLALAVLRASFETDAADVFVEKLRALSLLEPTEAARFLGAFRVANLDRFFRDLLAQLETDGDRETLLRRLRTRAAMEEAPAETRAGETAEDAVRVMTIHGAKGLDFTHTYVVQLHKGSRGGNSANSEVSVIDERTEYRLLQSETLGFRKVREQADRVEAAERVRQLYVAMTRAKERLVLLGDWAHGGQPVDPGAATCHLDLVTSRRPAVPDLQLAMGGLVAGGTDSAISAEEALWRFPSLERDGAAPTAAVSPSCELPTAEAVEATASDLREWCAAAEARAARPWNSQPSSDSHAEDREERADRHFDGARAGSAAADVDGAAKRAAGVVVHRLLEEFDLGADPQAELARLRPHLASWLQASCDDERALAPALARAEEVLDRLSEGPLLARLCALSQQVVARELPVLLPPAGSDDGAVGFIAGSIDLCYRDPDDEAWVVADYKTDEVRDPAEIPALVARYAAQGRAYQRALREAMQLDHEPRFELWLLDVGRVESVA